MRRGTVALAALSVSAVPVLAGCSNVYLDESDLVGVTADIEAAYPDALSVDVWDSTDSEFFDSDVIRVQMEFPRAEGTEKPGEDISSDEVESEVAAMVREQFPKNRVYVDVVFTELDPDTGEPVEYDAEFWDGVDTLSTDFFGGSSQSGNGALGYWNDTATVVAGSLGLDDVGDYVSGLVEYAADASDEDDILEGYQLRLYTVPLDASAFDDTVTMGCHVTDAGTGFSVFEAGERDESAGTYVEEYVILDSSCAGESSGSDL